MTRPGVGGPQARHELPSIDAAALTAARWADRVLRAAALRARAAYGPKDSLRDALPEEVAEPFRDALDLLLKELARHEARR